MKYLRTTAPVVLCLLWFVSQSFICNSEKAPRPGTGVALDSLKPQCFATLTDVHINSLLKGNVSFGRHNDTGDSLWARTARHLEKISLMEKPRFMVYLGDLPHHDDTNRRKNVGVMLANLRALNLDIPILYLPGNNDSPGGDYHSFTDIDGTDTLTPFSFNTDPSDPWPILHDTTSTARVFDVDYNPQFGFYSATIGLDSAELKVIALNTTIYSNSSLYYVGDDGIQQPDAADIQTEWFVKTMDNIKTDERVMIMMHIPPGKDGFSQSDMWKPTLTYIFAPGDTASVQKAFLRKVYEKRDNITGILTAHTHYDGLRRLHYSSDTVDTTMCAISISTPGITIGHGNNPGFKYIEYDPETFDLMDFRTYYAVPTERYFEGNYHSAFKYVNDSSYTFSNTYKVVDPELSMYEVIAAMRKDSINKHMKDILLARSWKSSGNFDFELALDVY